MCECFSYATTAIISYYLILLTLKIKPELALVILESELESIELHKWKEALEQLTHLPSNRFTQIAREILSGTGLDIGSDNTLASELNKTGSKLRKRLDQIVSRRLNSYPLRNRTGNYYLIRLPQVHTHTHTHSTHTHTSHTHTHTGTRTRTHTQTQTLLSSLLTLTG